MIMPTEYSFSAQDWIKIHLNDGLHLAPECLQAVQNFTLMWNLFESLLCGNFAKISVFDQIATRHEFKEPSASLVNSFSYFRSRYVSNGNFTALFEGLRFRRNDRQEVVEKALKSESPSLSEIVLATMLIVYRLRNNLFHGLKSVSSLNNQTDNLNVAARALAAIIELHGHPALTRSNHAASR
jgi:hypothetical protein